MSLREKRSETALTETVPGGAWLIGLLGWFVPGAGHVAQGRWGRGLLIGGAVMAMFIIGLAFGGHLFPIGDSQGVSGWSPLLQVPPMIANLGAGLLYLVCWVTNTGFVEQAKLETFEYGNTFLLVAGLLNYLGMLDAFDIAVGRKP
ncbi:MAG: hypothetical protein QOF02_1241 [Blastocatellia bacterium]|nr:hypothetical protein [Blastocatellia bacterium]